MDHTSSPKSLFERRLAELAPEAGERYWCFVPYDQLNDRLGALRRLPPERVGIVLVESEWKASRRPYHKQKLGLLLASQRHFALEQAARGVAVRYLSGRKSYAEQLLPLVKELGRLEMMRPAEYELREHLTPLVAAGLIEEIPHEGWLTKPSDFELATKGKAHWRMDAFYRHVRKRRGVLLDDEGKPLGGKWSHDADNRQPWRGTPAAPTPPRFEVDPITAEVCELVRTRFSHHPGRLVPETIPARRDQVEALWEWVKRQCMPNFGPYEDAMSVTSRQLFHGRISGVLNLHRLLPLRVITEVEALDIPLNSKEGFIRQVLGWREFVHHIHDASAGFRRGAQEKPPPGTPASPNALGANAPLPPAFWGEAPSGFACLDQAVTEVWEDAYTHHINRLMVLSNWATLLDVSPRELTDWFWVGFEDAYDWVVEPNVLGMGTFALGDRMVTKPYVSGSAYIQRMSDYCDGCAFHPKRSCPMTSLYWSFLERHKASLEENPRMRIIMAALRKRSEDKKQQDRASFEAVSARLQAGGSVAPTMDA